jgi:hypothetical protein
MSSKQTLQPLFRLKVTLLLFGIDEGERSGVLKRDIQKGQKSDAMKS